ncbi:unnamed protein product [Auanema sp. JU1783]|nr:unnamed protein product [Auanema sp. JU1783]
MTLPLTDCVNCVMLSEVSHPIYMILKVFVLRKYSRWKKNGRNWCCSFYYSQETLLRCLSQIWPRKW